MIYLKQFQIPSDLWVDWYFSPTPWGPDDSLILLDEPGNSLSAMWQKELAVFIRGAVKEFRCQFIIATHSPFLLSIPEAKIYDLDATPIQESTWNKLESMRCYYDLFNNNKNLFE